MEKKPVLRINGLRYKAKRLKMGAYRQIVRLVDDMETESMDAEDVKEDMLEAIRLTFELTPEQADSVDVADIVPTFWAIVDWTRTVFTSKLPNAASLVATPGE